MAVTWYRVRIPNSRRVVNSLKMDAAKVPVALVAGCDADAWGGVLSMASRRWVDRFSLRWESLL